MLVIDTHVLVWFVNGSKELNTTAKKAIEAAIVKEGEIIISSISAWEISMLIEKKRLVLSMDIEDWLKQVEQIEGFRFMPVDNEIGYKSTMLPGEFHKDTADRMIVATARKLGAPLVTADEKIREYEHVKTIW